MKNAVYPTCAKSGRSVGGRSVGRCALLFLPHSCRPCVLVVELIVALVAVCKHHVREPEREPGGGRGRQPARDARIRDKMAQEVRAKPGINPMGSSRRPALWSSATASYQEGSVRGPSAGRRRLRPASVWLSPPSPLSPGWFLSPLHRICIQSRYRGKGTALSRGKKAKTYRQCQREDELVQRRSRSDRHTHAASVPPHQACHLTHHKHGHFRSVIGGGHARIVHSPPSSAGTRDAASWFATLRDLPHSACRPPTESCSRRWPRPGSPIREARSF